MAANKKTVRNKEIFEKHSAGMSMKRLASEYQISIPRVCQILKKEQKAVTVEVNTAEIETVENSGS